MAAGLIDIQLRKIVSGLPTMGGAKIGFAVASKVFSRQREYDYSKGVPLSEMVNRLLKQEIQIIESEK